MRTNSRGRGRGRGQNYEAEAEANFPRPKITFNIIMFTTQTVQYINSVGCYVIKITFVYDVC